MSLLAVLEAEQAHRATARTLAFVIRNFYPIALLVAVLLMLLAIVGTLPA